MVTHSHSASLPRWYWLVAGLACVWMLFGVAALIMDATTDEAALQQLSEAQRQLYAARPTWLFGVYAVATVGGLAGAVALLLRSAWAVTLLTLSLAAVVLQFGYTLLVLDAIGRLGTAAALPFPVVIFAIGVGLLWFAIRAWKWGWIH